MSDPPEAVVRSSLYNWLGFGTLAGRYWFVGREESIALSKCTALEDWGAYFERRATFDRATDFRWTWEEQFGRPLETFGTTTWHYQIAFLLAFHDMPISSERVKRILAYDPRFCRTFSNHFSGEFFPCPKSSKNTIAPYEHIWDSVADYHNEVAPGRIDAFTAALEANPTVDWIITYSPAFVEYITDVYVTTVRRRWPNLAMDPIVHSELSVGPDRTVQLVETPFLGYGRISYDDIKQVVDELPTGAE